MATASDVFSRVVDELGYAEGGGLARIGERPRSGVREMTLDRVRRRLPEVKAVYFSEDVPLAYFAQDEAFEDADRATIHRKVWNDSRVPVLFVIDRSHVRVYDAWGEPTDKSAEVDDPQKRLIRKLEAAEVCLKNLPELHRARFDTGAYAADLHGRFDASKRCDATLIENLEATRDGLIQGEDGLPVDVAHRLLIRSILLLHLEHRNILTPASYGQYSAGARKLTDIYRNRSATYRLFERLAERYNGDLLPVHSSERNVKRSHLHILRQFLEGETEVRSGQRSLWPLYDFGVIPIQLISSVYERLLHATDFESAKSQGAYYTPYPLVELMLNEVLPWPGPDKRTPKTLPRIIDPSCGSGVFLVEAYRRIVAYWRRKNPRSTPSCGDLSRLLTEHIHGVDIDPSGTAVSVAAFSLYLAMLDELDPSEVSSQLRFPKLTSGTGRKRANLTNGDTFEQNELLTESFDLVVGNPPWKRRKLPDNIQRYCRRKEHPVAGEISQAFLWLAGDLAPKGRVAMLSPSKWLFNREAPDVEFRRAFLTRNHVDAVINMSALVSGSNRLFNANAPATAVVFRRQRPAQASSAVLYCAPRPASRSSVPTALLIDAGDVKWLPRSEVERFDDVWKTIYVGSWRDLRLLRRLRSDGKTLQTFLAGHGDWHCGRGFQPDGSKNSRNDDTAERILQVPFVDAGEVKPFLLIRVLIEGPWGTDSFKRTGPKDVYEGPHILVKEGIEDGRVCAGFTDRPCSFRDTITAIHAPPEETLRLKALTAYLNSSLASYMLFLISGWGIDRRRVKKGEVLMLPGAILDNQPAVQKLANLLDAYCRTGRNATRLGIRHQVDDVVFDSFELAEWERQLVSDMLRTSVDYVHNRQKSVALDAPTVQDLESYSRAFVSVFGQVLAANGRGLSTVVYTGSSALRLVSFHLTGAGADAQTLKIRHDDRLDSVLTNLDRQILQREGVNLYRRRHLRYFEDRAVHIIKPAELRCWTPSAAFQDADETLAQSLTGEWRVTG